MAAPFEAFHYGKEFKLSPIHYRPVKDNTERLVDDPHAFTWDRVIPHLQQAQQEGKTIVVAMGHFVFMHAGHSLLLEQGRTVGTESREDKNPNGVVVVAIVNSDHQTAQKNPFNAQLEAARDRALRVYDNRHSDFVVISEAPEGDTTVLSDMHRLAEANLITDKFINVRGDDYKHTTFPEEALIQEHGGQVVILPRHASRISSSGIGRRLQEAVALTVAQQPARRQVR